jgi:Flp pilus assembly pilin Flp
MHTILAKSLMCPEGTRCTIALIKSGISISAQRESRAVIAMMRHVKRLRSDESGSTAIEYSLIASVMGFMLIPFASFFAGTFSDWGAGLVAAFNTVMGL